MKPATGLSLAHRPAADEPHDRARTMVTPMWWPGRSSSTGGEEMSRGHHEHKRGVAYSFYSTGLTGQSWRQWPLRCQRGWWHRSAPMAGGGDAKWFRKGWEGAGWCHHARKQGRRWSLLTVGKNGAEGVGWLQEGQPAKGWGPVTCVNGMLTRCTTPPTYAAWQRRRQHVRAVRQQEGGSPVGRPGTHNTFFYLFKCFQTDSNYDLYKLGVRLKFISG
jgi:hypothetical protein